MADEAISLEDAAQGLLAPEPKGQPEPEAEVSVPEVEEPETEAELEAEAEADEGQPAEDEESEPEDGTDAEETEDDDDPTISLPDGSEEKFSELVAGRMRDKDYRQKTMALAEERKTFESESTQAKEYLQQQYAQLQENLATFAIAEVKEPDWENLEGKEYDLARKAHDKAERQKSEAAAAYRQIQAEQQAMVRQTEAEALLRVFPEWSDQTVFQKEANELVAVGGEYGISADEMAGIVDHRYIRILHELKRLKASQNTAKTNAAKVAKRAVKTMQTGTSPKPSNKQGPEAARRQKRDRMMKKGHMSARDAASLIIMEQ